MAAESPMGIFTFAAGVALGAFGAWRLLAARPAAAPVTPPAPSTPQPPAAEPQGAPFLDERHTLLYRLDLAIRSVPKVAVPGDLLALPTFVVLVTHFAEGGFEDLELCDYASGDNVILSCAASCALARRPVTTELEARASHWMNQVHPMSRHFTLRLFEAWYPADAALAGRVMARFDHSWWNSGEMLIVVDQFLRRRALVAPLAFGEQLARFDVDQRSSLANLLEMCEQTLVAPLRAELTAAPPPAAPAAESSAPPAPAAPASGAAPHAAGRVHAAGQFAAPVLFPREGLAELRERLLRALTGTPARTVLVAGETGVGKSTLVRSLAAEMSAQGWAVFETSAAELNAGMSFVGQLEGRIQELLRDMAASRRTLWLVRDFHLMQFAGRTTNNATAVLDLIMPAIESGAILLIGESRSLASDRLFAERPDLVRVAEIATLTAPREAELPSLARAWAERLPQAERDAQDADVLDEAATLARHHLASFGMPAGLVRVLDLAREHAAREAGAGAALQASHLLAALSQLTGLPADLLDDEAALDVHKLRQHFASRVLGQDEAVACLVDRLALVKAGIASTSRPYAVLLFAGPTGTGKTELVKALAQYLFGAADRMVRVDMSELQDGGALDRVLSAGGPGESDSLASRVRRQPFSVVLLDEFEKAHPRVWDLFLQVFDDGRLTNSRGETVDFRNTFIILTSNLGARLKSGERLGFVEGSGAFSAPKVERAVAEAFRPELLNRIDRIVVFRPLSRDTMREILRKQIAEAFERRGLRRREWAVEIESSAIEFLLERGFTSDLGARPLQRALDQHLLSPLARTLVEHRAPEGDQFLFVRAEGDHLAVDFVDPDAPGAPGAPAAATGAPRERREIAWDAHGDAHEIEVLRLGIERLEAALAEDAWTQRKHSLLAHSGDAGFWQRADRFEVLGAAEYMDRVEAGARSARSLLSRLLGERAAHPRDMVRRLAQQLALLEIAHAEALAGGPRDAFLAIEPASEGSESEQGAWRDRLVSMYESWARARGMRVRRLEPTSAAPARTARAQWLAVSGFGAWETLRAEEGLHLYESGKSSNAPGRVSARVRVAQQPPQPARDGAELARQAADGLRGETTPAVVRRYREEPSPLVRDMVRGWRTGRVERVLAGDFDLVPAGESESLAG